MDRWKATALVLAGILVGVVFAGPRVTDADGHQAKQFKECMGLSLAAQARKGGIPGPTAIPEGWIPIGGFNVAGTRSAGVVLCR